MSNFNKKDFDKIKNKCTHNKSLIPILEEEGIEVARFVWRWFENEFYVFNNINPDIRDSYFRYENGDGNKISEILFKLGLGKLEPVYEVLKGDGTNLNIPFGTIFIVFKDGKVVILKGFKHNGVFISIKNESNGLIATYAFIGTLLNIFERGLILAIDELDRHLHPDIVASIIKMVNNPDLNPKNGQLIFNTHSDSLLDNDIDLFRREQVWFIEKLSDEKGSKLFSFDDIEDYEDKRGNKRKVYRSGKIGARPYIREALLKFLGGNSEQEKR